MPFLPSGQLEAVEASQPSHYQVFNAAKRIELLSQNARRNL